jgi:GTP:adenosylcobinamide-phosphate guanylyltransferase
VESFPEDVRAVFRALAEARDGPFLKLAVDLSYVRPRPIPSIDFRIYEVADSPDAYVVVGVEWDRPDG